ncbi:MAG: S1 RNA-binding domain-containing protein [Anaerolineaceae bacterium]|jgi:predicted RNA-binding protein with RPS1 domain|nr:S1 RNA-binding domain-containing protein [Anaerolineaceae bacterium]MDP3721761.1 S1 RNA-binding domain-containing protein [Anaerolineaceae bacterium]
MDMSVVADTNRTIEPKMQFSGKVIKTRLAGAVIDIGVGKPAVLHISQVVAPEGVQIKRIEDVLKEGEMIDVWVKKVARKDDEERIELTMMRPLDLEWREIKIGTTVKGNVVRLEKFGAFVEIGAERPGLVHISEMAHGYVKVPGDVVKEGDEIEAQVIEVNRRKKQIKLSMKALQQAPEIVEEKPKPTAKQNPARFAADPNREKKPARKPRRRTEEDNTALLNSFNETNEPEPTVMEMAMKAAMEKAKDRKKKQDSHKDKAGIKEQEDILSRTLENKLETK